MTLSFKTERQLLSSDIGNFETVSCLVLNLEFVSRIGSTGNRNLDGLSLRSGNSEQRAWFNARRDHDVNKPRCTWRNRLRSRNWLVTARLTVRGWTLAVGGLIHRGIGLR
jgi:hypothetical protein